MKMENDNQNKLEIGTKPPTEGERQHYRLICSNTGVGFLNLLNENYKDGYKLDRDTLQFREVIDKETGVKVIKREAYLYDSEDMGLSGDEKSKRMEIIDLVDESEYYLYRKRSLMEDRENYLLLNTKWDEINETRKTDGLPKISNEKQRTAYLSNDEQLKVLKNEVQEATSWLKLVKEYSALHELPVGKAPWILEEEKATARDEMAGNVTPEKVRNTPAQEAE